MKAARARRRAQAPALTRLAIGIFVLTLCIALVVDTRGLILLVPAATIALVVVIRARRRKRARESAARVAEASRQAAQAAAHARQLASQAEHAQQESLLEERRRSVLWEAQELQRLLGLSPRHFEDTVGVLLEAVGYGEVTHVGGVGDRGADLTCLDAGGRRVVVQCKRYAPEHKVGSPEVQRFVGAIQIHSAQRGMIVTTSTFTREAGAIAAAHNVELVDGAALVRIAQSASNRSLSSSWGQPESSPSPPPVTAGWGSPIGWPVPRELGVSPAEEDRLARLATPLWGETADPAGLLWPPG